MLKELMHIERRRYRMLMMFCLQNCPFGFYIKEKVLCFLKAADKVAFDKPVG